MRTVTIAHAVCDERGQKFGGIPGDQLANLYHTTGELRFSEWYLSGGKSWDYVIRAKKKSQRVAIAAAAMAAVRNNNVGYDQNYRGSLYDASKPQFYPGDVKTPCSCDCTSLVTVCCNYAKIPLLRDTYSGNLKERCEAVGMFKIYKSKKYTQCSNNLEDGDILLRVGHHAAIVVNTIYHMLTYLKMGCNGEHVIMMQHQLNESIKAGLVEDGVFGFKTDAALREYQRIYKLQTDGIMGPLTAAHMGFLWR